MMASIEKKKVVTGFKISLHPDEYKIIIDSLEVHLNNLQNELKTLHEDDSYEYGTEIEERHIKEVSTLKEELEKEYYGEWVSS